VTSLTPAQVQGLGSVDGLRYNELVYDLAGRFEEDYMADETGAEGAAEPRLTRELAELRDRVKAGTHHGESFELTVTDAEVEETLAWYAERHSTTPFPEAKVSITTEGIELSGEARLGGLRATIRGWADVYLQDGIPSISITELKMGKGELPDFLRFELEEQLNRQLALREDVLPLIFDEIDLQQGRLTVRGRIR
jgi:hypothetical protein